MQSHTLAANIVKEREILTQQKGSVLWVTVKCWLCLLH